MVIWTSLQACGVVLPFAISTSICRSSVTICSGLYLLIDMTGLPPQVNSLSFHLVQKSPVRSKADATFEGLKQVLYEPEDRIAIQTVDPTPPKSLQSIAEIHIQAAAL